MQHYKSSIPKHAAERVVERYPDGEKKEAEYLAGEEVVGVRSFHETGEPSYEYGLQSGRRHGVEYRWDTPGRLVSAIPYENGLGHGTARQWADDGRLIGTYEMVRGTGIDLWRQTRLDDGSIYLCEVFHWKDGQGNGWEWWINEDQQTVYIERHWRDGGLHGIEREWNGRGRLRRGYPKYHVDGKRVGKRQYLKAAALDPTLPPFRAEDNAPARTFPPEIARHLSPPPGA